MAGRSESGSAARSCRTVAVAAGDTLRFNLNSVSSIQRLTVILKLKRYI